MNRQKRRAETRKYQREASHRFHPRGLARSAAHSMLALEGATGVNRVAPKATQSRFSIGWREVVDKIIHQKSNAKRQTKRG